MTDKKRFKFEWIIILILIGVIVAIIFLFLVSKNQLRPAEITKNDSTSKTTESPNTDLHTKYENLEKAYNKTIIEIESAANQDDINLSILKENLKQILETIKTDKEKLGIKADSVANLDKAKQLQDMLNMSKEVLAERLLEETNKNEKLTIDNRKLHENLKKSVTNFEKEKNNNVKLNDEVAQIKNQIKAIKDEGEASTNEIKTLERLKDEAERKLNESNKIIKSQNEQIQGLGEIIRKVNIDCYFYYEKGNPDEEALIYLTSQGISEKYTKYFVRQKPDIYVEFRIPKDFFTYNVEKLDLKLYNSLNIEIYSVSKVINSENMKIIIPNKNFPPGKYSIELKAGDEELLLDDKYTFKISS